MYSIVIPTLNEEILLPRLLDNLVSQRYKKPFEVLIVDAGSEDNTRKIPNLYKKRLSIQWIDAKRKNLSFQRNLGAQASNGEYVIFIDADSQIPNTFLSNLDKELIKTPYLICIPKIETSNESSIDKSIMKIANYLISVSKYIKTPITPGACLIIHRQTFLFLKGFKTTKTQTDKALFPEDMDFVFRAKKAGIIPKQLKTISFMFSLRRAEKEGYLVLTAKYLASGLEMILRQKSTLKLPYRMGGDYYIQENKFNEKKIKKMLMKIKNISTSLLK